ncbi:ATP-binding protein [Sphingobacterium griseoflavum]|uniref:histidine kinase n=1 Tax=Sphingobacterium griseoflavum TaxID=1474952 RepID=A0ABQ3HUD2_9SPHI|nr:ATP-binding protein [Sphingobacterium griseoflavum]GHE35440.1 histidine kinase [Sphingobacterium griseoflavum]
MHINQLRCEDEAIQFCGQIQEYGFLIVADRKRLIVAASENCSHWMDLTSTGILKTSVNQLINNILPMSVMAIEASITSVYGQPVDKRFVHEISLGTSDFYLSIYGDCDHLYLEFEKRQSTAISSLIQIQSYVQQIEQTSAIWDILCQCISNVIGFDRVMTYRFKEDNSGHVVAEKVKPGLTSYLGLHYPEFDIPRQARDLYLTQLTRHTSDIHSPTYPIHALQDEPIDLSASALRALSPIHLQYLEHAGVRASISFSIVAHGKLWGLVTCQHQSAKAIDLSQRQLAMLLTKYAVSRYLIMEKENDLYIGKQVKEFELALKEKLLLGSSMPELMPDIAEQLCKFTRADGFAMVNKGETFVFGSSPTVTQVRQIHAFINKKSEKSFYKREDFRKKFGLTLGVTDADFAGVVKMDMDSSRTYSLLWFRREQAIERLWAGKPEKVMAYDQENQVFVPSPRSSFDAWKEMVNGIAPSWSKSDIYFMKRVRKLIRESLLRKSQEIHTLNQELIQLNNALDTYAYTVSHDLKNPLSVIKLSVQMLQSKKGLSSELLGRLTDNMKDASELMEDMLDKIYECSKVKQFRYEPTVIQTEQLIPQIVAHCQTLYTAQHCQFTIGELHPIHGEPTLIYQLFSNVISNAIKYSSKQADASVHIFSVQTNGKVRYTIEDNGIGIPQDELKHVFDMFKRMSNSSNFDGSGVGLAIVKRIVERLGAQVDVESEIGKGTIFHLYFPN